MTSNHFAMNRITHYFLLSALLMFAANVSAQNVKIDSPDGRIRFTLSCDNGQPAYSLTFNQQTLIDRSALGFEFDNGMFGSGIKIGKITRRVLSEEYDLPVGKTSHVISHSQEAVIPLIEKTAPHRTVNLVIRVFDDAAAFRWEFPEQGKDSTLTIRAEQDEIRIAGNPRVLALYTHGFINSHEGLYTRTAYDSLQESTLIDMPTLFEYPDGIFMGITEANILGYPGMYLVKENGRLISRLSPHLDNPQIVLQSSFPCRSPWRVFMIGDRIGTLIESNILTNLCDPCKIDDVSWLKPGKTDWPWWNGNITPDTTFYPGHNFATIKYYIDFCADNGITYHSLCDFAGQPWYRNDAYDFFPGPGADVTKPEYGLNMPAICEYARSRGVDIRLWVHWEALNRKMDEAFALYEKWGVKGLMVDFMDRDDQQMIAFQEEVLQKAAKHHLHIQFHGASKPSGLHRTYPNEFTREGALNYEYLKWQNIATADHDISMPFARLLAGPTDYHLGGFRAVTRDRFKPQVTRPLQLSTRCHMLAMYVVLEGYLGLVCDYPEAYKGEEGFEFILDCPTVWDQIVVPDARVGEYVIIARRHGDDWYVGAITNGKARTLNLSLDFLGDGTYTADIYTDAEDVSQDPNRLAHETREVTGEDTIELPLAADGGAALRIIKK